MSRRPPEARNVDIDLHPGVASGITDVHVDVQHADRS